ncbi:MAG: NAD(P)/FAD-dependent oxidoreductase, partial [Arenimonas sp.]|nr:NAD(P)/FAD-dependent oxidoreductase [Arenimonas sp.]
MNTPIPAGKTYHSVIIGGGHNGLVCAATLARAGKSVLVLEAASQLGGAARNREFAPGYNVSAAAHLLHGLQEDVVRDLDLAGHGLRIAGQNISTHALIANGSPLRLGDRQLSGDGLSDADIAAYARFTETMARYAGALLPVLRMVPPRLSIETWAARIDFMKIAWGIRRLGRADMRDLLRIIGMNMYDLLDEYFESDLLKGALAFDAVLGAEWGPRSPGTVLTYLYRLSGIAGGNAMGVAQPIGGLGAVCAAMATSASAAGAQLRTSARVRRIVVEGDRACGVELDSGEVIRAEHILSNVDPRTTFLSLLGPAHLDAGFVRKVHHLRASGRAGKLHLALRELPKFTGVTATAHGDRLLVAPSMNYLERAFNPSKYREYPIEPALEITLPTVRDGKLAPAGRHVLSAVVQFLPYDDGADRDANRALCLETILRVLERHAPGIRNLVTAAELLTPFD